MKPDIVLTHTPTQTVFIMDTKWKLLSDEKSNYGIAQSDMYQMYAYQKKYSAKNVTLLYPKTDNIPDENIEFRELCDDGVTVRIRFLDLFDIQKSLATLSEELLPFVSE